MSRAEVVTAGRLDSRHRECVRWRLALSALAHLRHPRKRRSKESIRR